MLSFRLRLVFISSNNLFFYFSFFFFSITAMVVRFITRRFIGEYDPNLEKIYTYSTLIDNECVLFEILDATLQINVRAGRLFHIFIFNHVAIIMDFYLIDFVTG